MVIKHTKEQAKLIVDGSLQAFGLPWGMKTDPKIIQAVIEEFKLDDFKTDNKQFNKLFKEIVSRPQELSPLFDNITKGIISKHPAIIEFAELALKNNWFKQSKYVIKSVHVMYLLEILTATMCNSHQFFIEVQGHYRKKEQQLGLDTIRLFKTFINALNISPNFFDIAKSFSIDPLLIYFKIQRGLNKSHLTKNESKKLYKQKKINYVEYKLLSPIQKNHVERINQLVRINIYEAGITEYKKGLKNNAISAHVLSEDLIINPPYTIFKKKSVLPENSTDVFYKVITEEESLFPVIKLSQKWVSLYTAWNMTFVLGNLNDLEIIFPKLLIPSIIDAESENFIGARIISLWLTVNHTIFRKSEKKEIYGPDNKIEMAEAWSIINKKYAFELADQEIHEDSELLLKNYNRFFAHPVFNLFKIAKIFIFGK
ncbi:hypothetical protein KKG41_03230 [Patescibacteria group bacterium]|nr:hypothetical protein [Patescibacteria group bacterium]